MGKPRIHQSAGEIRRQNTQLRAVLSAVAQRLGFEQPPTVAALLACAGDAGKALAAIRAEIARRAAESAVAS